MLQTRRSLRLLAALAGLKLLSCGREVTGPGDGLSYGRGLVAAMRLEPVFPAFPGADAISDLIPFTQVRVTLRRTDGQVAKDTVIDFPSGHLRRLGTTPGSFVRHGFVLEWTD